jgi:lipoprotein-anchoring transpeptidase ErfK/SrfK
MIRTFFLSLLILILGLLIGVAVILFGVPALQESTLILPSAPTVTSDREAFTISKDTLESEINSLQTKLDKFVPKGAYIVVNTSDNHFYLYKDKELIRDGICSTGKNETLIGPNGKPYVFYTPPGVRTVQSKHKNPVWAKPDWAFIEDGLPIPPKGDPSRFEAGTLGAYKLVLGDGYMIHGTLYKRFMGLNVTHGCIRLLDEDLESVYKTLEIGSKVYIF